MSLSLHAQNRPNLDTYINRKLQLIDSLIIEGQYDKAVTIINNTQNTFAFKANDKDKLALEYRHAQILYEGGDEEQALDILLRSYEKFNSRSDVKLQIDYLNFLARIFANSQNFDKAIHYNKIALEKSRIDSDTVNAIKSLIRLGSFYYAKKDVDSAKFFYRRVKYIALTPKTQGRLANAYNNLGVIAQNQNNFSLAKYYAGKALEIKQKEKDTLGMAYLKVNLGNLYHYEGNYSKAILNYDDAAISIVGDSSSDALNLKNVIYDNLSISYDSLKDYKSAYHSLYRSNELNKKLAQNHLSDNIAEVEAKYNLAKEEHKTEAEKSKAFKAQVLFYSLAFITITFLILIFIFYNNYKLKQQNRLEQMQIDSQTRIINATIDAKEEERRSISEILHDSVSALLSSANLHLQASKAQLKSDAPEEIAKAQSIVKEASVKIRNLSHELISSVLLKFGLAYAVHDLCEKYSNSDFSLLSDDNGIKRYDQKFEIKIYHIIEELVNNIIKHSNAENANINLKESNGVKLIIQIIDDGKGFDVRKERKKDGLGLSHIEARIKVLKGVFNINSKIGEGTSIFISVPIDRI